MGFPVKLITVELTYYVSSTFLIVLLCNSLDLDPFACMIKSFLPCVAVGPNRTKLVTPNSSLKFTPEELVLYCRDMRVICFLFDRLTPDTQVIEVCVYLLIITRNLVISF